MKFVLVDRFDTRNNKGLLHLMDGTVILRVNMDDTVDVLEEYECIKGGLEFICRTYDDNFAYNINLLINQYKRDKKLNELIG